jgi:hypothetical protein
MHYVITVSVSLMQLVGPLALYGLGIGLVLSQISNITLSAVGTEQAGEASGINNTVRQLGSTLGSAIIGAVLISVLLTNVRSGIQNSSVLPAQAKSGITTAAIAQSSSIEFGNTIQVGGTVSSEIKNEVASIAHASVTTATRTTLWYTAAFSMIAFLFSFTLPKREDVAAPATKKSDTNITDSPLPQTKQAGRMSIDEALAATTIEDGSSQKAQPMVMARETAVAPIVAPTLASVHQKMEERMATSAHIAPTTNTEKKSRGPLILGTIVALLLAVAAGLWAGYAWGKHHAQTDVATTSTAQPGPLYTILAQPNNDVTSQPLASRDVGETQTPQVLGASVVSPEASVAPASAPAQATTKTYTYSGASLAITIPTSWVIHQSDQDGTTLDMYDSANMLRGELFIQAGVSETLDQKRTELEANSQVSNITDTTFHGIPALSYDKSGISGTNIVLEYDGNLYTFNQGAEHESNGYSVKFL